MSLGERCDVHRDETLCLSVISVVPTTLSQQLGAKICQLGAAGHYLSVLIGNKLN